MGTFVAGDPMDKALKQRIVDMISSKKVFLFMKGTPDAPQCGFSMRVVNCLRAVGCDFGSFDVLDDEDVRQGIKEFANWPTIPQLYVDGTFVGGCDITEELMQSGELAKLVGRM